MKKKLIIDKYTQPIFPPYDLYILINATKEDIKNNFKWGDTDEIEDDELNCNGKGVVYSIMMKKDDPREQLCIVIDLHPEYFDHNNKNDYVNAIAHEANHVTFRMLNYCSIKLDDSTSEVFAYVQGWVTECIYKSLKKKRNE